MPTTSAFLIGPRSQRVDEGDDALVGPGDGVHTDQAGAVVPIGPDPANRLALVLGALDLPLLTCRGQRILAHQDDHPGRATDPRAHLVLPAGVVRLLHRHVHELVRRPRAEGLALEEVTLTLVLDGESNKNDL